MTDSPDTLTRAAQAQQPTWSVCDQCQAPLEERQRYCVVCGARRLNADDPAVRYLAAATRRARAAPPPAAASGARRSSLLPAVLIALIPLAAAIGVMTGRSQGDDEALVRALKSQGQPVINITGAGAAGETTAASTPSKKSKAAESASGGKRLSDGARVLATGPAGSARQLEGSKVSAKQLEQSREAVKRINESKGKAYVESQRNLPDQIVIP